MTEYSVKQLNLTLVMKDNLLFIAGDILTTL